MMDFDLGTKRKYSLVAFISNLHECLAWTDDWTGTSANPEGWHCLGMEFLSFIIYKEKILSLTIGYLHNSLQSSLFLIIGEGVTFYLDGEGVE